MRMIIAEEGVEYKTPISIKNPEAVGEVVKEFAASQQEVMIVIGLTTNNTMLYCDVVTVGLINSCQIAPREVFRTAITKNAAAIILAHNHPSGNTSPSSEDIRITKHLANAGKTVDINVIDHVVFSHSEGGVATYSMRENGLANF